MNAVRRVCVLTISDRTSQGITLDTAGPAVVSVVRDVLHWPVVETHLVPDEVSMISQTLCDWADHDTCDLILTVGGTGLSPRDVTPEATLAVLHRRASPLMELARLRCFAITPKAYLSRGEAGIRHRTLIINLPGSRRGSVDTLNALIDILPHALSTLAGERNHPQDNRTEK
jgi:molybdenum cofactor synthesis domain-containing protein